MDIDQSTTLGGVASEMNADLSESDSNNSDRNIDDVLLQVVLSPYLYMVLLILVVLCCCCIFICFYLYFTNIIQRQNRSIHDLQTKYKNNQTSINIPNIQNIQNIPTNNTSRISLQSALNSGMNSAIQSPLSQSRLTIPRQYSHSPLKQTTIHSDISNFSSPQQQAQQSQLCQTPQTLSTPRHTPRQSQQRYSVNTTTNMASINETDSGINNGSIDNNNNNSNNTNNNSSAGNGTGTVTSTPTPAGLSSINITSVATAIGNSNVNNNVNNNANVNMNNNGYLTQFTRSGQMIPVPNINVNGRGINGINGITGINQVNTINGFSNMNSNINAITLMNGNSNVNGTPSRSSHTLLNTTDSTSNINSNTNTNTNTNTTEHRLLRPSTSRNGASYIHHQLYNNSSSNNQRHLGQHSGNSSDILNLNQTSVSPLSLMQPSTVTTANNSFTGMIANNSTNHVTNHPNHSNNRANRVVAGTNGNFNQNGIGNRSAVRIVYDSDNIVGASRIQRQQIEHQQQLQNGKGQEQRHPQRPSLTRPHSSPVPVKSSMMGNQFGLNINTSNLEHIRDGIPTRGIHNNNTNTNTNSNNINGRRFRNLHNENNDVDEDSDSEDDTDNKLPVDEVPFDCTPYSTELEMRHRSHGGYYSDDGGSGNISVHYKSHNMSNLINASSNTKKDDKELQMKLGFAIEFDKDRLNLKKGYGYRKGRGRVKQKTRKIKHKTNNRNQIKNKQLKQELISPKKKRSKNKSKITNRNSNKSRKNNTKNNKSNSKSKSHSKNKGKNKSKKKRKHEKRAQSTRHGYSSSSGRLGSKTGNLHRVSKLVKGSLDRIDTTTNTSRDSSYKGDTTLTLVRHSQVIKTEQQYPLQWQQSNTLPTSNNQGQQQQLFNIGRTVLMANNDTSNTNFTITNTNNAYGSTRNTQNNQNGKTAQNTPTTQNSYQYGLGIDDSTRTATKSKSKSKGKRKGKSKTNTKTKTKTKKKTQTKSKIRAKSKPVKGPPVSKPSKSSKTSISFTNPLARRKSVTTKNSKTSLTVKTNKTSKSVVIGKLSPVPNNSEGIDSSDSQFSDSTSTHSNSNSNSRDDRIHGNSNSKSKSNSNSNSRSNSSSVSSQEYASNDNETIRYGGDSGDEEDSEEDMDESDSNSNNNDNNNNNNGEIDIDDGSFKYVDNYEDEANNRAMSPLSGRTMVTNVTGHSGNTGHTGHTGHTGRTDLRQNTNDSYHITMPSDDKLELDSMRANIGTSRGPEDNTGTNTGMTPITPITPNTVNTNTMNTNTVNTTTVNTNAANVGYEIIHLDNDVYTSNSRPAEYAAKSGSASSANTTGNTINTINTLNTMISNSDISKMNDMEIIYSRKNLGYVVDANNKKIKMIKNNKIVKYDPNIVDPRYELGRKLKKLNTEYTVELDFGSPWGAADVSIPASSRTGSLRSNLQSVKASSVNTMVTIHELNDSYVESKNSP